MYNKFLICISLLLMFTSIAHVQLLVNSYDDAIKFYTDKLGFVLTDDQPMPMMGENMRWVVVSPTKDNQKTSFLIHKHKDKSIKKVTICFNAIDFFVILSC
jgi:predicted enzyme related to lactoylglutathione lyase